MSFCVSDHIFYQQRLPAWQPLLNARSAFPIFLVIGIVFVPLGVYLFIVSEGVHEFSLDYTHCWNETAKVNCSDEIARQSYQLKNPYKPCYCSMNFELKTKMEVRRGKRILRYKFISYIYMYARKLDFHFCQNSVLNS